MDKFKVFAGAPLPLPSLGLEVHQPRLREIAEVGEAEYFSAASLFINSDKEEFKKTIVDEHFKEVENVTEDDRREFAFDLDIEFAHDIDVFLYLVYSIESMRSSMTAFLYTIFPQVRGVEIGRKAIKLTIAGDREALIDNKVFPTLRDVVDEALLYRAEEDREEEYVPANALAESIAEKMRRAKERRKVSSSSTSTESPLSDMASILATSDGLSIVEVLNLTYPQLIIQHGRSSLLLGFMNQITMGAFGGLDPENLIEWTKPL